MKEADLKRVVARERGGVVFVHSHAEHLAVSDSNSSRVGLSMDESE